MAWKTGTYTGNGAGTQAITGLGFTPGVVWDKPAAATSSAFKTRTMPSTAAKIVPGSAVLSTAAITSLDLDGFTVTGAYNTNGVIYYYIAFEEVPGEVWCVSYAGTGVAQAINGFGFQGDLAMTMADGTAGLAWKGANHTGNNSQTMNAAQGTANITTFAADGFNVGTGAAANSNGVTYHAVVWKNIAGYLEQFSYPGNGPVDNYAAVSSLTFAGTWIVTKARTTTDVAAMRHAAQAGDTSMTLSTAETTDIIQSVNGTGFEAGTHLSANAGAGVTYAGFAFNDRPSMNPRGLRTRRGLIVPQRIGVQIG